MHWSLVPVLRYCTCVSLMFCSWYYFVCMCACIRLLNFIMISWWCCVLVAYDDDAFYVIYILIISDYRSLWALVTLDLIVEYPRNLKIPAFRVRHRQNIHRRLIMRCQQLDCDYFCGHLTNFNSISDHALSIEYPKEEPTYA